MGRTASPVDVTKGQRAVLLRKERKFSEQGRHRWADRCRAIRMRGDDLSLPVVVRTLHRPRRTVQAWCRLWRREGVRGLEPKTSSRGRKRELGEHERMLLAKVIQRGPRRAGFAGGVWTSPMIAEYVRDRWRVDYTPGYVRQLLPSMGFSLQFPREKLALADVKKQDRWLRRTLPGIKKKPRRAAR